MSDTVLFWVVGVLASVGLLFGLYYWLCLIVAPYVGVPVADEQVHSDGEPF